MQHVGRAIHGQPEAHHCDACRRVRSTIHPGAAMLPAAIDQPGPLIVNGPVVLIYGLCTACEPRRATTAALLTGALQPIMASREIGVGDGK
jgi:hypothetical protein